MENLGVDPKLLIAQIINFGLFFFIFSTFIAKPFLAFIQNEKKKDAERARANELAAKQETELMKKEEEMKLRLKREYDKALHEAKNDAVAVRTTLMSEAKSEAEAYIAKAKKEIGDEKKSMEREMKERVGALSVVLVERGLREYLTDDMQKGVTKRILTHLETQNLN